jgi:2-polyprenyl-3-methyl-5-hydroxy-6-metoxy-1,4-benzoquinol methylase
MIPAIDNKHVTVHFDSLSTEYDEYKRKAAYYYDAVMQSLRRFIPPGQRVLELGCGTGTILNSLQPSTGLGIDISPKMIQVANKNYPHLRFEARDVETLVLNEEFDFVVMVDLVEHLSNVENTFRNLANNISDKTVVISSSINPIWATVLHLAEKLKLKMPEGEHYWPSIKELKLILDKTGFYITDIYRHTLIPKKIPLFSDPINKHFPNYGPLSTLSLVQILNFKKKGRTSIA